MDTRTSALTVFVVEDSEPVRTRLTRIVTETGDATVVGEAIGVTQAIEGIRSTLPESVVLDLHLVDGSGLAVLRTIKRERPGIHFVVLTSFANDQYRKACMAAGAEHVLDKLSQFDDLPGILHGWREEARPRQQPS